MLELEHTLSHHTQKKKKQSTDFIESAHKPFCITLPSLLD